MTFYVVVEALDYKWNAALAVWELLTPVSPEGAIPTGDPPYFISSDVVRVPVYAFKLEIVLGPTKVEA